MMKSKILTYSIVGMLLLVVLAWSYGSTLVDIVERWLTDAQYSHCWLVPIVSAYLLYHRRKLIPKEGFTPQWWGLGVVLAGVLVRGLGVALYLPWLDAGSLVIVVVGMVCTAGGRAGLRWAWPAAMYLAFMMPLPFRLQNALGGTLQNIATIISTYILQTVGVAAVAEGHVIALSQARIGVEEACNGLSMLVTFFALSVLFALVIPRGWGYKLAFVLAAAPIAVLANVFRITVTGLLYEANQDGLARVVFHDIAGWLMMPLGAAMLLAVMLYIDRIVRVSSRLPKPSPQLAV